MMADPVRLDGKVAVITGAGEAETEQGEKSGHLVGRAPWARIGKTSASVLDTTLAPGHG